jgi:hypothetical protein
MRTRASLCFIGAYFPSHGCLPWTPSDRAGLGRMERCYAAARSASCRPHYNKLLNKSSSLSTLPANGSICAFVCPSKGPTFDADSDEFLRQARLGVVRARGCQQWATRIQRPAIEDYIPALRPRVATPPGIKTPTPTGCLRRKMTGCARSSCNCRTSCFETSSISTTPCRWSRCGAGSPTRSLSSEALQLFCPTGPERNRFPHGDHDHDRGGQDREQQRR